jgi:hypothetical protein
MFMESLNVLLIYMSKATMPNKSGIQIIQLSHFLINVIDRFILKIKNI